MDQTFFNDDWLKHPDFKESIKKDTDTKKAYCKYCKKYFALSKMGIQDLKSHTNGKKHQDCRKLVYFQGTSCKI